MTRSELIGIMRPRLEEILEDIRTQLEIAGFYELKSQKFVLTGALVKPQG